MPDKNVLNLSKFRVSLINIGQSTSADHSPGASSDKVIDIGVGVGAGLAIVLISALVFFLWQRREKKRQMQLSKLSQPDKDGTDRCQYCHQGLAAVQKSNVVEVECPPTKMHAHHRAEMD